MAAYAVKVVSGTYGSIALMSDGTLIGWGDIYPGISMPVDDLSSVTDIAAGEYLFVALKSDGTAILRYPSPEDIQFTEVKAIAAGFEFALVLHNDGSIEGFGDNSNGQLSPPPGLTGVEAIAGGGYHSLALLSDGTVVGWGRDNHGQATPPQGLSGVTKIAAGGSHSAALTSDGTVVCWGENYSGQTATPAMPPATDIACGNLYTLAAGDDGQIYAWGSNNFGETYPPPETGFVVAVGSGPAASHSLAINDANQVLAFGRNNYGQCDVPESLYPQPGIDAALAFSADFEGLVPVFGGLAAALDISAEIEITATLSGEIISSLQFSSELSAETGFRGDVAATLGFSAAWSGYQDWLSVIPPIQLQEVYRLVITGAPDGLDDLHIGGISSWQATNQAGGRSSYVQAVIPAAEALLPDIQARQNGELVIQKGYKFSTDETRYEEILRSRFDTLRPDRGQRALTVTVSGYLPGTAAFSGSRTLTGIRTISIQNGKRRVRCDIDLFLQPGMTVSAMSETFRAGYINYYVSQTDKFCEVGER